MFVNHILLNGLDLPNLVPSSVTFVDEYVFTDENKTLTKLKIIDHVDNDNLNMLTFSLTDKNEMYE